MNKNTDNDETDTDENEQKQKGCNQILEIINKNQPLIAKHLTTKTTNKEEKSA